MWDLLWFDQYINSVQSIRTLISLYSSTESLERIPKKDEDYGNIWNVYALANAKAGNYAVMQHEPLLEYGEQSYCLATGWSTTDSKTARGTAWSCIRNLFFLTETRSEKIWISLEYVGWKITSRIWKFTTYLLLWKSM